MTFKSFAGKHPATCYFITTFIVSWLGAFILIAPKLLRKEPITKTDGIIMFPIMLIGPSVASVTLTAALAGKDGLRNLALRMGKWKVDARWYAIALIIPPCLIIAVLLFLKNFVSTSFSPNFFPVGFLFGIPAGFLEEIGWTGYALPKILLKLNIPKAGVILGLLWGLWHLPVIDFLGAASPHGQYLMPFFLSFIAILTAIRLLMTWAYSNTNSILLAQLMHIISTGCLVTFGPKDVSPAQETLWYASYAVLLWITVLVILATSRSKRDFKTR